MKTCGRHVCSTFAVMIALLAWPAGGGRVARGSQTAITHDYPVVQQLRCDQAPSLHHQSGRGDSLPLPIAVSGLKGKVRDVNLRLNGIQHRFPRDLEVLLVGPSGKTVIVMANVGQGFAVNEVVLTLDDQTPGKLPAGAKLQSGAFQPTNTTGQAIPFFDPAPVAGANAALSVFNGSNPNGTWRLFIQDEDGPLNSGVIEGGWTLEIETLVKPRKKRR